MDKIILTEHLKIVLSTAFSLYLKAHNYHWNVSGPNFIQYHSFFEEIYTAVFESIDLYAEHIRALDSFTPGSLKRFQELTKIEDELNIPDAYKMVQTLYSDNKILLEELTTAVSIAQELKEHGITNFLEEKLDQHEKLQWKLKSILK